MDPFKYTHGKINYLEGMQYFAVKNMSAILIGKSGIEKYDKEEEPE